MPLPDGRAKMHAGLWSDSHYVSTAMGVTDLAGLGKKIDRRGLTFYRLADGKIVETHPFERPDLTQELAALMPSPAS